MEFNFSSPQTNGSENVYHGADGVFINQAAAQNVSQTIPIGGGIMLQGSTGTNPGISGNPGG